jgi:hypothetical protein
LKPGLDSLDLAGGQLVGAGAQRVADPIQRVRFAAAMTELFLLDPAARLFHRPESEPDHMKGVQHGGGILQFVADCVGVAAERIQRRRPHPGGEPRAAARQPVGVGLAGAARHQVQQRACGRPLCLVKSTMPVNSWMQLIAHHAARLVSFA